MKELVTAIEIKVAGHPQSPLTFSPGPSDCGDIHDGVSFNFRNEGGWVISFTDLRHCYEMACKARGNR